MLSRRAFIAATSATAALLPSPAGALVGSCGAPGPPSDEGRTVLSAVALITVTQYRVGTVWRPPALFPPAAPAAYYVAHGDDRRFHDEHVIWLNPDHPELISPRISRLLDEVPLLIEYLLASADLGIVVPGARPLGLEHLAGEARRDAATVLAGKVAVIGKYTVFPAVDDAAFARRAFAFAVLRQMTPYIGGVAPLVDAARVPSGEFAVYAGRDVDLRFPAGWGVIYTVVDPRGALQDAHNYESWVRAFVLATADRDLSDGDVKHAYGAAVAADAASGSNAWTARRAFAAPYVAQVAALFGK